MRPLFELTLVKKNIETPTTRKSTTSADIEAEALKTSPPSKSRIIGKVLNGK